MANIKSAQKAIRSSKRKAKINQRNRSNIRSTRKELESALSEGAKKSEIQEKLNNAYKAIDKAAKKSRGVISPNKANRMKSKLGKAAAVEIK